jgi:hypothetical protein
MGSSPFEAGALSVNGIILLVLLIVATGRIQHALYHQPPPDRRLVLRRLLRGRGLGDRGGDRRANLRSYLSASAGGFAASAPAATVGQRATRAERSRDGALNRGSA